MFNYFTRLLGYLSEGPDMKVPIKGDGLISSGSISD